MKKLIVDDAIFKLFPETKIGVIVVRHLTNKMDSRVTTSFLSETASSIQNKYSGKTLAEIDEIKRWREAYKKFNANKKYRSSIESLYARTLKGKPLPTINPLVDFYNAISLKYAMPCGGEDLHRIKGNIRLTFANGDEPFYEIGSDTMQYPVQHEIIYKDDAGCICRNWNWREADRTKITEQTNSAILVIESISSHKHAHLNDAIERLSDLLKHHMDAQIEVAVLDLFKRELQLDASD
ncbi:B3/B4 domain-containing protein [Fusibacter ferrireducens]|uniref:B3/B4 tRNA-binding domain-containing protein n=1 Tax=Fusibacter ferrireducens TaxID=2785058 RepID=A0ABR9ZSV2_9FIRM|nr:phenylalanine--tRNA ligase beta subunit-related protein [Fusibacter ferrireducens]MBF4693537.1 hypothetical protein [Fusibacter ferrireducens]